MRGLFYIVFLWLISACSLINGSTDVCDSYGAVVRRTGVGKNVHFVFTADSAFEGATEVLDVMKKYDAKGSFFLTGNCLRMREHEAVIRRIIAEGHYIGGHSDRHLLYADWDKVRTNLVSADSLISDLNANYEELERFGVKREAASYFLPPYEWYNAENVKAIRSCGVIPINFTTGLSTSEDYTSPDMERYRSSQELVDQLFRYESEHTLDGSIVLIHPGTTSLRTDKLYHRFDEILQRLTALGYTFSRL